MRENQNLKNLLSKEFLHSKEIAALSALLAGEISAVEAYNVAIERVKDESLIATLEESRNSHALRVVTLQDRMEILNEIATESSGWWGAVVGLLESGATLISDKVALNVLAAGEDYGFDQYVQHMKDLDAGTFYIVETEILPAQSKTLQAINMLLGNDEQRRAA